VSDLAAIRYDLIAPLLRRYKRRFSVLDVGAGINPYIGQRISNEFDCVYVAIEKDEIVSEELAKLGPRAIWLRKQFSAEDLYNLSLCEHFDVVLGLNILHHFKEWLSAFHSGLRCLGDLLIIQTPYPADTEACGQDRVEPIHSALRLSELLGTTVQFPMHMPRPIYAFDYAPIANLSVKAWEGGRGDVDVLIESTYEERTIQLRHKYQKPRPYIYGLNLWNFVQLGGAWPTKDHVLQMIRDFPLPEEPHGDMGAPWNYLLDGKELHLIDGHEGWGFDDRLGLQAVEQKVEEALQ
jgi:hypothetical protein